MTRAASVDNVHELRAAPQLEADELRLMYRLGSRSRVLEEHVVRLVTRGEVKFAIWGPGEEVHGTAMALALSKACDVERFGLVPHYRSGAFAHAWCVLHGVDDLGLRVLRQQFSKGSDVMSGGRQMVYHLHIPEVGILPVQSPVGMQLGKAAGWALGLRKRGITDGVAVAIVGDGTTAEGDMHDAMNAASVWQLPLIVVVTDNGVAISTHPEEGRGIKDFATYAEAFGFAHFSCDGRSFDDSYQVTWQAARYARTQQAPVLLHVHSLPRFNGHSSAADVTFDLHQEDPLIRFGRELVERGVFAPEDVLTRREASGRDFFAHHDLGRVMGEEDAMARKVIAQVRAEPDPDTTRLDEFAYPPFPAMEETPPGQGDTLVSYAGAIRSALHKLIERHGGHAMGQDIGALGGVMTATAGLKALHPEHVVDAPLNEPLICGVSTGLALHDGLMGLPEIQFGDYSFNAFHWFVYWGTVHWSTLGQARAKLVLRMPSDPFGGGAMYHSMSLDGYFSTIPGLVVIMPSTSFDAHGLLLTAGAYDGPVICLEPKWLYRQTLGPAFPGEDATSDEAQAVKRAILRGEVPELPDVYVPFGKGAVRRQGSDVTLVSWGRAVWRSLAAAEALAAEGVQAEVIDLRTLVPPDLDLVRESVGRTGRLVVAAEDRAFAGFGRAIQGAVVEALPGTPTRVVGQRNLPGIGQSLILEEAQTLTDEAIAAAVREVLGVRVAGGATTVVVPHRYWIT